MVKRWEGIEVIEESYQLRHAGDFLRRSGRVQESEGCPGAFQGSIKANLFALGFGKLHQFETHRVLWPMQA